MSHTSLPFAIHFFRLVAPGLEHCFAVELTRVLSQEKLQKLTYLLRETFGRNMFGTETLLKASSAQQIIEIGPRLNFETPYSSNMVAICHSIGLTEVTRIEKTRRYLLDARVDAEQFIALNADRMTECQYISGLNDFTLHAAPQSVQIVPVLQEGEAALKHINSELGLGFDAWDVEFYANLFVNLLGRNPTDVECFQLAQANSEHSRHWFFNGRLVLDGVAKEQTLFEIVKQPLKARKDESSKIIAFHDNASAIRGTEEWHLVPKSPGQPSRYVVVPVTMHITLTAETHNHPSTVEPYEGAATGVGGLLRDKFAAGRGSAMGLGINGYCVGPLFIPGYEIPGEGVPGVPSSNLATALQVAIRASNGASDYANQVGYPLGAGFFRSFGMPIGREDQYSAFRKVVVFVAGMGQIDDRHVEKNPPETGDIVVRIGGPAFRVGVGGGAASSMGLGDNQVELDFASVQRGNGEMGNRVFRVVTTCIEMGDNNPIKSIHDQGAGGPCNVLTELVHPAGGRIDVRKINSGDATLSVLELWSGEFQEGIGLLIAPKNLAFFQAICVREKVPCEVLGEVTGDGHITLIDSQDNTTPVHLPLDKILGKMPQKTFELTRVKDRGLKPFVADPQRTLLEEITAVFAQPHIGSKEWLLSKIDHSVGGRVIQSPRVGPLGIPLSNYAVLAQSHFSDSGSVCAVGERSPILTINPAAGARMAVAEALLNLVGARIRGLDYVSSSVNWMWPGKTGEFGADLLEAATALSELMEELGIVIDGGKDSMSMRAKDDNGDIINAPYQVVVTAYAAMRDVMCRVTPDLKGPAGSQLIFIDLSGGKMRLGGSALAQSYGQIGDECPDVNDPALLKRAFGSIQRLIYDKYILSLHDKSDGGLITTIIEMCMAGVRGAKITLPEDVQLVPYLFNEELGLVIEVKAAEVSEVRRRLEGDAVPHMVIGHTASGAERYYLNMEQGDRTVLYQKVVDLHQHWARTSHELEKIQMNPVMAVAKYKASGERVREPMYRLSYLPVDTPNACLDKVTKPRFLALREEGSNGDADMRAAAYMAGFEVWDANMSDLIAGRITLEQFQMIAFVGGFSFADAGDSAKGWSAVIRFNEMVREQFEAFYLREDTLSLGVCNGAQLSTLLGWVPFKGLVGLEQQPRFIQNKSQIFESGPRSVRILPSPAVMLREMAGSVLPITIAHGEGQLYFPDAAISQDVYASDLIPIRYVNDAGLAAQGQYPFNPNGSAFDGAALCSIDGRHLAMMPHPERCFQMRQWQWVPEYFKNLAASPWLTMFQNARDWCMEHS